MNLWSALAILLIIAVIGTVCTLVQRAKQRAAARRAPQTAPVLRSAIAGATPPLTERGVTPPTEAAPAAPVYVPEPQPEPEPEPEPTAEELIADGDQHMATFDYEDAIGYYDRAMELLSTESGRDTLQFADLLIKSEDAYFARDTGEDVHEANCDSYKRALAIIERIAGPHDQRLLPVLNRIISFYFYQGKVMEAETLMRRQGLIQLRASQGVVSTGAPTASDTPYDSGYSEADQAAALGDVARHDGQYDRAIEHYNEAVEEAMTAFGRDSVKLVPLLVRLSQTYFVRDLMDLDSDGTFFTDPVEHAQLALALAVKASGPRDRSLAPLLINLAALSDLSGDHYKAERYAAMLDGLSN